MPGESFVYLGDTARLPYGTKGPETVRRYAQQAAAHLVARDVKMIVIACNTASAVAVEHLRERLAPVPVVGVIDPGARALCAATTTKHVAVLATPGTVSGGAYEAAISGIEPSATVTSLACALFVSLAEEGWASGPVAEAAVRAYLQPLISPETGAPSVDALVLGCTHFPILRDAVETFLGPNVTVVDSAGTTARAVKAELRKRGLETGSAQGDVQFLATDEPGRFAHVGAIFIGESVAVSDVERIDL